MRFNREMSFFGILVYCLSWGFLLCVGIELLKNPKGVSSLATQVTRASYGSYLPRPLLSQSSPRMVSGAENYVRPKIQQKPQKPQPKVIPRIYKNPDLHTFTKKVPQKTPYVHPQKRGFRVH